MRQIRLHSLGNILQDLGYRTLTAVWPRLNQNLQAAAVINNCTFYLPPKLSFKIKSGLVLECLSLCIALLVSLCKSLG